MHILAAGLDYKTTPVEIRERLAFQDDALPEALQQLRGMKSVLECTIVSTCNRTEVYAVCDQLHTGRHFIKKFLSQWFNVPVEEFNSYLNIRENDAAVQHLLRVVTGLDSMVLGETQILGQVKDSFLLAQEQGATGTVFNELLKQAVTFAKKVHHETEINDNAVSVSYAAVELGRKILGDFRDKHVMILGAGKMSELTAKHLHANGAKDVTVLNRTYAKAAELAEKFLGKAESMTELQASIQKADVVISSTGANEYVIKKDMMEHVLKKRKGRPLFMVDIAVPRDLDPGMDSLDNVFLYDIDDLQGIVAANLEERKQEAAKIEEMIQDELKRFKEWVHTLGVVPVISALRTKALNIQAETMDSIERKLPDLSEREKKVLRKHTKSIINQMLRDPITRAKELAAEPDADETLALFTEIFALEEEVELAKEAEEQQAKVEEAESQWNKRKKHSLLPYAYGKDVKVRS
ncbi:glutamyl-tRNA reductase [Alteribacillus persepolensis]|uniref:Glutamyl-tRNA reductase n=1 Tax=Alteribacillus persepolensis TaxID=568899 RepID=A0A1G8BRP4_9BACI|nr:glutamyl-tRNA reductase [Alteribacillus persepolensis]SDH35774.1 glutamyl-tRNA reductase [Alteribacillus persepolensis]